MQIQVKANPASLMMEGDTEKLVRVFNNLLSNALKYGKGGHHIVMEVDKVGTEAIIAVRNDGPAIPKHSLDQLFDRFYRVEESRSQETGYWFRSGYCTKYCRFTWWIYLCEV